MNLCRTDQFTWPCHCYAQLYICQHSTRKQVKEIRFQTLITHNCICIDLLNSLFMSSHCKDYAVCGLFTFSCHLQIKYTFESQESMFTLLLQLTKHTFYPLNG